MTESIAADAARLTLSGVAPAPTTEQGGHAHLQIEARTILSNAGSLVGTTFVTSSLGFVYWLVAARQFSPLAVGFAAASVSAMTILGTMGMLGLGTLVIGELPRWRGREGRLISTALAASGLAGAVLGLLFAAIAPLVFPQMAPLGGNIGTMLLFATGVALTSLTLVLDTALIGLLRSHVQTVRNAIFALAKLLAVVALGIWIGDRVGLSIYATWLLGNVLSIAALFVYAASNGAVVGARPAFPALKRLGRPAVEHHALNLALQVPAIALPIIVSAFVSVENSAYFYAAWMIAVIGSAGPIALANVLYAVNADSARNLARTARFTLAAAIAAGAIAALILLTEGDRILRLFGPAYARAASTSLRLVALGVFAIIVKHHFVAVCRVTGRLRSGALIVAVGAALELALATAGGIKGGLTGLSLGWLIAVCGQAVLMGPRVYRAATASDPDVSEERLASYAPATALIRELPAHRVATNGNGQGPGGLRVHIIGAPAASKTTLARSLTASLGVPAYDLDEVAYSSDCPRLRHSEAERVNAVRTLAERSC